SIASPSCCRTRRPVSHHQEEAKMLSRHHLVVPLLALVVLAAALVGTAGASKPLGPSSPTLLYGGLSSGLGSTVGPGRALYVTDPVAGQIVRVDPTTGAATTFADCLPRQLSGVGLGGAMDVAFIGGTAYALVTLVDPLVGGADVDGIYRI